MKRIIIYVFIFVFIYANTLYALTGREIMERNDALKEANTSIEKCVLLIVKGSKQEKKVFEGIMKKYGEKTRTRISFSYPTQLEFLIWDEPGQDSQQWTKLSSGRVRKIASSDKDKPWVNSHFYNEDISDYDIDDFTYKSVGEETVNGVQCYKVEAVKKTGTKVYSKRIVYICKSDYVRQRIDFFEKGRHTKTITFTNIEKISGIYTPRKVIMERTDGKGKSILYVQSVQYDEPVSDERLNKESF